jgi:phosphoglycolate phosphatase
MLAIFDLDGTLIDTPSGIVESFSAVFFDMGKDVDANKIRATIGMPLEKAFGDLLGVDSSSGLVKRSINGYQDAFKSIVLPKAKSLIYGGVVEGLRELKKNNFLLAIATSKYQLSAINLLTAAGLYDMFHLVVGADDVAKKKPHPEMGYLILDKLNKKSEESFMVGDTTHDILMGNQVGIKTIAVTYGVHNIDTLKSAEPDVVVDNFSDAVESIMKYSCARAMV